LPLHATSRLVRYTPCAGEIHVKNRSPIFFRRVNKPEGCIRYSRVINQDIKSGEPQIKGLKSLMYTFPRGDIHRNGVSLPALVPQAPHELSQFFGTSGGDYNMRASGGQYLRKVLT
jgi:hypothetical protein